MQGYIVTCWATCSIEMPHVPPTFDGLPLCAFPPTLEQQKNGRKTIRGHLKCLRRIHTRELNPAEAFVFRGEGTISKITTLSDSRG